MTKNFVKIRWKKQDYINLQKAVRQFNKIVSEEEKKTNKTHLPNLINYKDIKSKIYSRREYNRIMSSLNRIKNKNALNLVEFDSGMQMSVWEARNLKTLKRNATASLNEELKLLEKPSNNAGFSRVKMGSVKSEDITDSLLEIETLETLQKETAKRVIKRLENIGSYDFNYRRALNYQKNMMKEFSTFSNISGYKQIRNFLKNIKNPLEFYEIVSRSETLKDFFVYYKQDNKSSIYGNFESDEDMLLYIMNEIKLNE